MDFFAEESLIWVPGKLIRELGLFLIPASRSWDRMLSFGSELFKRVIRSASGLPAETILAERDRLRKGRTKADKAGGGAKPQARNKRKDVTTPPVEGENGKRRKATKQQICSRFGMAP